MGSRGLICTLLLAPLVAHANGVLRYTSEPGDYIGLGKSDSIEFSDEIEIEQFPGGVIFGYREDPRFRLELRAPEGHDLKPACYEKAQRAVVREPHRTGLDFDLESRGCNTLSGRFKIIDIRFDPSTGAIESLAVDFLQHCSNNGSALSGQFRYNSDIPADGASLEPAFNVTGNLIFSAEALAAGGGEHGNHLVAPIDRLGLAVNDRSADWLALRHSVPPDHAYGEYWSIDIGSGDKSALMVGQYQGATGSSGGGTPILRFSHAHEWCQSQIGSFSITAIDREPWDNQITRLNASFDQHCGNSEEAPLTTGKLQLLRRFSEPDGLFVHSFEGIRLPHPVWACQ